MLHRRSSPSDDGKEPAMRPIPLGAKGTFSLLVAPQHLANQFKDEILPPVLATPVMIMMMENAALNAIRPFLDPGEGAVGTMVNSRHLAATPVGQPARANAPRTKGARRRHESTCHTHTTTQT